MFVKIGLLKSHWTIVFYAAQRDVKRELFESLSWCEHSTCGIWRQRICFDRSRKKKRFRSGGAGRHGVGGVNIFQLFASTEAVLSDWRNMNFIINFIHIILFFLGLPVTSLVIENPLINVNFSSIIQLSRPLSVFSTQDYANRKEKMLQLRKQKEEEVFQSKQAKETQLA